MDFDSHILNCTPEALPEFLYRIVPLERFARDCARSTNVLVSPFAWSDPYEAAQLRTQLEFPLFVDSAGVYSTGLRDDKPRKVGGTWRQGGLSPRCIFCQCWSDLPESDAMWRLYSPDEMGVKLRVASRHLLTSLRSATGSEKVFLGAMEYLEQRELDALIRDAKTNHLIQMRPNLFEKKPGEAWARCMLRKRSAYKHESEYRLILAETKAQELPGPDTLSEYAVDYNSLIDEIELDPRCKDPSAVEQLLRTSRFTGSITKSKLYQPPNLIIRPSWPESDDWSVGSERKWIDKE